MTRKRSCCSLLLVAIATVGCGADGGATAEAAPSASAGASTVAVAASGPGPAATAKAQAAPAAAASAAAKPAPKLTSLPSAPVPAGDLRDAYFHWIGETVHVAGYPATFFDEDYWSGVDALTAVPEKGAPGLVDCRFAAVPEGKVARTTPVVVRGKVEARTWATTDGNPMLQLGDCEVVAIGEQPASVGEPWQLDGRPIAVQALHEAALGWQGRKVQVVGRYHGSTHSSAGDLQRHDIADASGKVAVGCSHRGSAGAPASAVGQRDGVVVEGTIGEPMFDQLTLENCRFVNRS